MTYIEFLWKLKKGESRQKLQKYEGTRYSDIVICIVAIVPLTKQAKLLVYLKRILHSLQTYYLQTCDVELAPTAPLYILRSIDVLEINETTSDTRVKSKSGTSVRCSDSSVLPCFQSRHHLEFLASLRIWQQRSLSPVLSEEDDSRGHCIFKHKSKVG